MKPNNHWAYNPRKRREVLKKISVGWGKKPITQVKKICPNCNSTFKVKKSEAKRRKYCSKACFNQSKKGVIPPNIEQARRNSPIQKGDKNINWKGGIYKYPSEWTGELRRQVFAKFGNRCQDCGKVGKKRSDLVCHHIDFDKKNCQLENLILLCRSCHMKRHWRANKGVPGLKKHNRVFLRTS